MSAVTGWQPISEIVALSEYDVRTIIVTDGYATTALAFCEGGDWYLGDHKHPLRTSLDFEPEFWVPRSINENPFRLEFPDGRGSIWTRFRDAYPAPVIA